MRIQTSLLSLFLLALILAPHVDASAKKKKVKKGYHLYDEFTGLMVFVSFPPSLPVLMPNINTTLLVQSVPEESQVSRRDEQVKIFGELINEGQYGKIVGLGEGMSDKELLECLCQVVTNLDHFKGIYEYLKRRDLVPDFLAHGDMVLVREVIAETGLLKISDLSWRDSIYDGIVLSLKEDRHERVAGLFEAAKERPTWKSEFSWFVDGFFERYPFEKNSMPLKRFLTLHGEEFSKKHPITFGIICQELVWKLKWDFDNLVSQKLLIDLVGQPSLLTPVAFVVGFLWGAGDNVRADFINYGYKEAIEEGLKKKYPERGRKLWDLMVYMYPDQLSREYPSTDEARSRALTNFKPTKQDREEAWARENAPNFQEKVLACLKQHLDFFIPSVLVKIIYEYTTISATWLDVE